MKRLLSAILILLSYFGHAQDDLVVLLGSANKEEKVVLLNEISAQLVWSYPDSAMEYAKEAEKLAIETNDFIAQSVALRTISSGYYLQGNADQALETGRKALDIAKEHDHYQTIAAAANNLGLIYQDMGKYESSIEFFQEAIDVSKEMGESPHSTINNMANSHYYLKNYEESIHLHEVALEIRREDNNISGIADCLNDIGLVYLELNQPDTAIDYIKQCIRIKDSINDVEGIAFSTLDLASVYLRLNENDSVIRYANLGLEAALELESIKYQATAYEMLALSEYRLGNYKKAYEHHVSFKGSKDSILNEESLKNISQLEARYENQKRLAEITQLEKEKEVEKRKNEQKEAKIEKDRLIKVALFGGLGLLLILAFVLLKGLRRKKKDNELISQQNELLEDQKEEIKVQHQQLALHHKEVTDSITYAQRIQNAILPPLNYTEQILPNSFVFYLPKDIVAGDFYWFEPKGDKVYFAAADCTGHGVPGAMVSVVCHNTLNRAVREFNCVHPSAILDKSRELVMETFEKSTDEVKDGMDIAICAYSPSSKKLEFAGANNGLFLVRGEETIEVKPDKQPIGKYDRPTPFTNHEIQLQAGDFIYVFSDGFPDQFGGPKGKKLKYKAFKQMLVEFSKSPASKQCDLLLKAFKNWKGNLEQLDDVCVVGFQVV